MIGGQNTVAVTNTYTSSPVPATLVITDAVNAPSGSPQASTTSVFTGNCPTAFTTAALANGGSATPTVTAVVGNTCTITTPALGTGWTTTASINGAAATTITPAGGTLTIGPFAMIGGQNTVAVTNTYTATGTGVTLPAVGAAGWTLNGSAVTTTGGVKLTAAGTTSYVAGSTFYSTPVST